jgi:hypothetical protein
MNGMAIHITWTFFLDGIATSVGNRGKYIICDLMDSLWAYINIEEALEVFFSTVSLRASFQCAIATTDPEMSSANLLLG